MKNRILKLGLVVALHSSLYAYSYDIKDGIQELDVVANVSNMEVFNNTCIDYILYKDTNSYKLHIANGVDYNYTGTALESLSSGDKVIVKANSACTVDIAPELEIVTHNGITYGTVVSPYTGRIWLDRNVGASSVCSTSPDAVHSGCFGDYYQWGRNTDGHQTDTARKTTVQKNSITNTDRYFVIGSSDWTTVDSSGTQRSENWSKTDGSSICPAGYRVPTTTEFLNENMYGTIPMDNFLKLPLAGKKTWYDGNVMNAGVTGNVWTSTSAGSHSANTLTFSKYSTFMSASGNSQNSRGYSVRCIKE